MYDYSPAAWLLIFYIYCFFGWVFECIVVSVQERRPINRGFLRGPMLPIYGFGATIMLHVALPLAARPQLLFFSGIVVATAFEYMVGAAMEAIFNVKYWDYSAHRFQLQGRICLQSSLAWGVLSVALVYLIHPPIVRLLLDFNPLPLLFTVLMLSVYFLIDIAASTKTALDFSKFLAELDALHQHVRSLRLQLSEAAAETRDMLTGAAHGSRERLSDAAENARVQLLRAIAEAEKQMNSKIHNMKRGGKGLVRGNPTLRSARFAETLREIRARLK